MQDLVNSTSSGSLSCEHLVNTCLEDIQHYEHANGVYSFVDYDGARSQSKRLDFEIGGREGIPPLFGLPIAVKEIISVAGMPSRASSNVEVTDQWASEGEFVKNLRALGCVPVGLTQSTEFAFTTLGLDCDQPWNPAFPEHHHTTGGSSQGSAAAVAADLCAFALGTDTGGSVRLPASLCGIVGYLPTHGIVPSSGVYPLLPLSDSIGLITRTIEDLIFIWSAIFPKDETKFETVGRYAFLATDQGFEIDPDIWLAFSTFKEQYSASGAICFETGDFWSDLFPHDYASLFLKSIEGSLTVNLHDILNQVDGNTGAQLQRIENISPIREEQIGREICSLRDSIDSIFPADCDVFVCPTAPMFAPRLSSLSDQDSALEFQVRLGSLASFVNKLGLCAVTLPLWTPRGPMGIQLVGKPNTDHLLLRLASEVQSIVSEVSDGLCNGR